MTNPGNRAELFDWLDLTGTGSPPGGSAAVLLVTTDDYLRPEIRDIAGHEIRPWLLARTTGSELWLGPLFRKGTTVCWFCLAAWIRTRRYRETAETGWRDQDCPGLADRSGTPESTREGTELALKLARDLTIDGCLPELESAVIRFTGTGVRKSRVIVPRRSGCLCHGTGDPPKDLGYWTNPVTGLIDQLGVTGGPVGGFYHARAIHYSPLPRGGRTDLVLPGTSFGRGRSQSEAELGCIAEGLERYSAIWQGDEPEQWGSRSEIENALDPASVLQYSARQYEQRPIAANQVAEHELVPRPLVDNERIAWTRITELLTGVDAWLPTEYCYMWRRTRGEPIAIPDSNGCAAGRDLADAQKRGLLELIERDAVAIWWANRIEHPGVPWEAFADGELMKAVADLRAEGLETHLLDLTTDLGVPVYAAIGADGKGRKPCLGMAAAEDGRIAAWRALGELSQIWIWTEASGGTEELAKWQS